MGGEALQGHSSGSPSGDDHIHEDVCSDGPVRKQQCLSNKNADISAYNAGLGSHKDEADEDGGSQHAHSTHQWVSTLSPQAAPTSGSRARDYAQEASKAGNGSKDEAVFGSTGRAVASLCCLLYNLSTVKIEGNPHAQGPCGEGHSGCGQGGEDVTAVSDQGLHVSKPGGPCFELPPKLISMASLSGWDQDEDECSCDHAQDGGNPQGPMPVSSCLLHAGTCDIAQATAQGDGKIEDR